MAQYLTPTPAAAPWMQGLDPRGKIISVGIALIVWICTTTIPAALWAFVVATGLGLTSKLPLRWLLQRLSWVLFSLIPLVLLAPWLNLTGQAWGLLLLKTIGFPIWVLWLLGSTRWEEGISALGRLGFPQQAQTFLLFCHRHLALTYRRLLQLRLHWRQRGFRTGTNRHAYRTIAGGMAHLLENGERRAKTLQQAMQVRGFTNKLILLEQSNWSWRDTGWLVLVLSAHLPVFWFRL